MFIPSPVRVGTLLMEVPGTPIGAPFFEFELKPTGKDSADPTLHEGEGSVKTQEREANYMHQIQQTNDMKVTRTSRSREDGALTIFATS